MQDKKDFKAVKVSIKTGTKNAESVSRSMLCSGVNIFGQLTAMYLSNKDQIADRANTQQFSAEQSSKSSDIMNIPYEVLLIFKKLQKKDPVTKAKALGELELFLSKVDKGSEEHSNLLAFFLYHYCRIMIQEHDKQVREAAQRAFGVFITKSPKRLSPHLAQIFPVWFCSFFDSSTEVQSSARQQFNQIFKENVHVAFKLSFKNFLHFADEQLRQTEDQLTEALVELSKVQKEENYDRIISSVFQALAESFQLVERWEESDRLYFQQKLVRYLGIHLDQMNTKSENTETKSKINEKNKSKLWQFMSSKQRGKVRAACLQFATKIIQAMPFEVENQLDQIVPLMLDLVQEDNSFIQHTLWRETFFVLGKQFPLAWDIISLKKTFIPGLMSCLKNAGFGAPFSLYPNLVKFASVFPLFQMQNIESSKNNKSTLKDKAKFLTQFFQHIFSALKNEEASIYHKEAMYAYTETLIFLLIKRVQLVINEKTDEETEFLKGEILKIIILPVNDFLIKYEKCKSKAQNQRNVRSRISENVANLIGELLKRNFNRQFTQEIIEKIIEEIQKNKETKNWQRLIKDILRLNNELSNENKKYIENHLNQKIIKKIFKEEIKTKIKQIGRNTMVQVFNHTRYFVKFLSLFSYLGYNLDPDCISETDLIEILLSLDSMQIRNSSMLQISDIQQLDLIKSQLLLIFPIILDQQSFVNQDNMEFLFGTIFTRLQTLTPQHFKQVIQPQNFSLKSKKFSQYFKHLRSAFTYSEQKLLQILNDQNQILLFRDLIQTVFSIDDFNQSIFIDNQQANRILSSLVSKFKDQNYSQIVIIHLLKSCEYIICQSEDQKNMFNSNLRLEIQEHLIQSVLCCTKEFNFESKDQQELWFIMKNVLLNQKSDQLKHRCTQILRDGLSDAIQENIQTIGNIFSFKELLMRTNRLSQLIKDFLLLCDPNERTLIATQIVLNESNFAQCDSHCLPLKLFRDIFLEGGIGFDVQSLLSDSNFEWLIFILVNVQSLPSLTNYPQLKKQLLIFTNTEVIPLTLHMVQKSGYSSIQYLIGRFVQKLAGPFSQSYLFSFIQLIRQIANPSDQLEANQSSFINQDDFRDLYNQVCRQEVLAFIQNEEVSNQQIEVIASVLVEVGKFIREEDEIKKAIKFTKKQLHIDLLVKSQDPVGIARCIAIYLSLKDHFLTDYDQEMQETLTQWIIANYKEFIIGSQISQPNKAFAINQTLRFLAQILDTMGVNKFLGIIRVIPIDTLCQSKQQMYTQDLKTEEDQIKEVAIHDSKEFSFQNLILETVNFQAKFNLDSSTLKSLLTLVRKVIGQKSIISEQAFLIDQILEMAKEKAIEYKKQIIQLTSEDNEIQLTQNEKQIDSFEEPLIQEFSEAIFSCSNLIDQNLNEETLFEIINCCIPQLQKAAFLMLSSLYKNFIPRISFQRDEDLEIEQLQEFAIENKFISEELKDQEQIKDQEIRGKSEFKNIPRSLLKLIENPPPIEVCDGEIKFVERVSNGIQEILFGQTREGCLSREAFAYLLAWSALLQKNDEGRVKAQLQRRDDYQAILGTLSDFLEQKPQIYEMFMEIVLAFLPKTKNIQQLAKQLLEFDPADIEIGDENSGKLLCIHSLSGFMKNFPSLGRKYFQTIDKRALERVIPYLKQVVSPAILENEILKIEMSQIALKEQGEWEGLSFTVFKSNKEILTKYTKGEISMELKILIPSDYPLKAVQIEVGQQLRISERQKQKWVLAIRNLLQQRNGDIISAVLLWKNNIDKEVDGMDDCCICYCVLHPTDKTLPKLPCKQCKNKFHVSCIRKWFKTSNKSKCPLCQAYFF